MRLCAVFASLLAVTLGCARWYEQAANPEVTNFLPAMMSTPETVDLETVVIRFREDQVVDLEDIWTSADEGFIDFSLRSTLDRNGLRIGIIRGELPKVIQRQFQLRSQSHNTDLSEVVGLGSDADAKMRMIRCRSGRRTELVLRREINQPLSIVTSIEGLLSGQTFTDRATALFALTPFPTPDGRATIEMIPEVQYGESQHRFTTTDFGMRQELKRPSKVWKALKFRSPLEQGNVLVVAATQPPKSLGGAFFVAETVQQVEEHLVLLIRLSATPMDDLFANEKLATSTTFAEKK